MRYARTLELELPPEDARPLVRAAFQEQGFERQMEIDVRHLLQDSLVEEIEDYVILGAWHPWLARQALEIDRDAGLLTTCNVVVRRSDKSRTIVQALDPDVMVRIPEQTSLAPIATEARRRIDAALGTLAAFDGSGTG